MSRRLLLLALTSAACFSDDPPQLTATVTGDDSSTTSTGAPVTTEVAPTTTTTGDDTTSTSATGTTEPATPTTSSTTGETDTTSDTDTTGGPVVDPCKFETPVCPAGPSGTQGSGQEPLDRCNFPLTRAPEWDNLGPLADALAEALPTWTMVDILADLNNTALSADAVPGDVEALELAFRWDNEDFNKYWWIPQGLTGSADARDDGRLDGREVALIGWWFDKELANVSFEKGVRVTLVDVTDASELRLRHILLVEPVPGDPVDFKPVPVRAGGIAWYGDTLYLADPTQGLRVFDLSRLLEVNANVDKVGYDPKVADYYGGLYSYVAVQIGAYKHASACAPRFSTLALDRSTSPPELVVGEYCDGLATCASAIGGRVFTWPLDPVSGRLPFDITWANSAAYTGETQIQGVTRSDGALYLTSSAPPGDPGALHVVPPVGPATVHGWIDTPRAVMLDGDRIWGMSEKSGARFVFAAARSAYEQ
ncbi:hypothetical protein [Nannocystis bainbridge]|uniref:LVIVD repeat-containing protein n=1 Tax=Nannocystis bainbridge TaxID=2995303 RepID=A0ABT5EDB6_9BACT|nr:hypothetical protein [Nannocystis bainbridge]MDC0723309.1 hypothetical protein [Nannocystis bainbridge]